LADDEAYVPTKTDLLLAIDAAIGNLVTLRNYVDLSVKGPSTPVDVTPAAAKSKTSKDPHDGHKIVEGGFGEPNFCLDCDEDVGVSPVTAATVEP
jgi:hypothetical protein